MSEARRMQLPAKPRRAKRDSILRTPEIKGAGIGALICLGIIAFRWFL